MIDGKKLKEILSMQAALGYIKTLEDVFSTIDFYDNNSWTPCSEQLPEKSGNYLVTYERPNGIRRVDIDDYWLGMTMKDGRCPPEWHTAELTGYKVIAWMQLPEPWEEQYDIY